MAKDVKKEVKKYKAPSPGENVEKVLIDLCNLDGVPGHEREVYDYSKKFIIDLGLKTLSDNLGSIVGVKKGTGGGPKVLIAGHLDEIGFLVTKIEDSGYLKITPIGGWWGHTLLSQRMCVTTREGKKLWGLVGSTPPHVLPREQVMKVRQIKDLYIDMGCKSKDDVLKAGIRLGDPVIPSSTPFKGIDKNVLFAKALDNRAGVAIALLLLERLVKGKKKHYPDIYVGATVQEEVGLRGARTLSYKVDPDIALAVDVTISSDHPGMDKTETIMGDGVTISIVDGSTIGNPKLIRYLEDVAKKNKIAQTFDALTGGGTDAGAFHLSRSGAISTTISIATRYIHSHYAVCHMGDVEAAVQLLEKFVLSLTEADYKKLS